MYHGIETRLYNHCCRANARSITYLECLCVFVFVCSRSYPARKVDVPYYTVICGL